MSPGFILPRDGTKHPLSSRPIERSHCFYFWVDFKNPSVQLLCVLLQTSSLLHTLQTLTLYQKRVQKPDLNAQQLNSIHSLQFFEQNPNMSPSGWTDRLQRKSSSDYESGKFTLRDVCQSRPMSNDSTWRIPSLSLPTSNPQASNLKSLSISTDQIQMPKCIL